MRSSPITTTQQEEQLCWDQQTYAWNNTNSLTHQLKQLQRRSRNYRGTKQTKRTLTTHRQPQAEHLKNTSRRWRRDHAPSLLQKLFLETSSF